MTLHEDAAKSRSTKNGEEGAAIRFEAQVTAVESSAIVILPKDASATLPSRGMVMVEGTVNDRLFLAALEPDGSGSHWFRVDEALRKTTGVKIGDTIVLAVTPIKDWPEPELPADLSEALTASPEVIAVWQEITPMARWDWIRWVRSTNQPDTRRRRIQVACSKLASGMRRPCCFNRSQCTDPSVSKNGMLLAPTYRKDESGYECGQEA
jgi:hypothetical protein